jgi:cation:H+ antiporter
VITGLALAVAGIVILSYAADAFVEGAARLAVVFNVTPIVIGAVIIGFGTSAPEMLVSAVAARNGDVDLGIGNIIGSNTANLSLILGSAALMVPIVVSEDVLKREAIMATGAAVVFALAVQGGIQRWEGVALFVLLVMALTWVIRSGDAPPLDALIEQAVVHPRNEVIRTVVGLVGTVAGAAFLVEGATTLADELGLNDGFIGVTLVAVGTSLPELVTSVAAARQGSTDLIVGNLLGSNLFNSLAVGAVVGVLGTGEIMDPSLASLDTGFMLVVCIGAFAAMWTRSRFTRLEGGVLVGVFVLFVLVAYISETTEPVEVAPPSPTTVIATS